MTFIVLTGSLNSKPSLSLSQNYTIVDDALLSGYKDGKAPYSSKIDIYFQERFNKLIYCINTIIKC